MVFDRNGLGRVALLSGIVCLVLSTVSASEELVSQNADVTPGQLVFNNVCRMCHSTREGDNRLGPHVRGIIGRKAGSLPNYSYSSAMRGANFVWDEENLERFIANPRRDSARQHHEALRWFGIGGEQSKADRFLEDPCGRSIVALVLGGKACPLLA